MGLLKSTRFPNRFVNPLSTNPTKWSNTLKLFFFVCACDHFIGLALKGLKASFENFAYNPAYTSLTYFTSFTYMFKSDLRS